MTFSPLKVGILGGGQLAQMLSLAARRLGITPYIFVKDPSECAALVTSNTVIDDSTEESLRGFLREVDVVTIENEFINLKQIQKLLLESKKAIYPSIENLTLVQSKLDQKNFLLKNKIPTLRFSVVSNHMEMEEAWEEFQGKLVIKRARFGYDGRGTFIFNGKGDRPHYEKLKSELSDLCYAEEFAPFKKELAVIVTRSKSGEIASYDTIETRQENGMCLWTKVPAEITKSQSKAAQTLARKIVKDLKAVGTFGIEFFLLKSGQVVVNEIAPRVHNSGHFSMNSCSSDQFEQHLRAVAGLQLGSTKLLSKGAAMLNIIGAKGLKAPSTVASSLPPEVWLHWYGKEGMTYGRKLGHVNAVDPSPEKALKKALALRKKILV